MKSRKLFGSTQEKAHQQRYRAKISEILKDGSAVFY